MNRTRIFAVLAVALLAGAGFVGAQTDPVINEIVRDNPGTDMNEYVEIFGDASTDYSAYTLIEIEGEQPNEGIIDTVVAVGTTDANGIWWSDYLTSNEIENGTNTFYLVEGFTGAEGDDLDTDADGMLDSTPWTRIVDDFAIEDSANPGDDIFYSAVVLSPGYDGNTFEVGGASRIPDGFDSDMDTDFVRNDFDGAGIPDLEPGTPDPGEALNTPGLPNEVIMGGGDDFTITGECPGEIVISYTGGTPGSVAGVVFSTAAGNDALAAGPCAGEETELSSPALLTILTLDGNGEFSLTRQSVVNNCGLILQVVDGATCTLSNSATIP